jgi:hypothetical protein
MEPRGGKREVPAGKREEGRVQPQPQTEELELPLELPDFEDDLDEFDDLGDLGDLEQDGEAPQVFPPKTLEDPGEEIPLLLPLEEEEENEAEEAQPEESGETPSPAPQPEEAPEEPDTDTPEEDDEEPREPKPKKPSFWSKAAYRAESLTDRVLDWTEELTDRFDDMASDPENDSLAARMIRGSEDIMEGLEDQQWETDQEIAQDEKFRASRQQPKRERKVPHFVFYRAENAPKGDDPGIPEPVANPNRRIKRQEAQAEAASRESTPPEEEAAQGPTPESLARRHPRKPEPASQRAAASRHPISKEERKRVHKVICATQYWAFLLFLGVFTVVGLLGFLRPDTSEVDQRSLSEKPTLSLAGLWSGDYFGRYEQWYSDTFPLRERLAGNYDHLRGLGFGESQLTAALPVQSQEDSQTAPESQETEPPVEESVSPEETPGESETPQASETPQGTI